MSFSRYTYDYPYQVFISYSIADRDWACKRLLPGLRADSALQIENSPSQDYQAGVDYLVRRLRRDARHNPALQPELEDALIYQQRLRENISKTERYGDNDTLQSTRSEIRYQLNRITDKVFSISFNDWSELIPPGDPPEIEQAIGNSCWIILVLTPDWISDESPKLEAALTSADKTINSRIIPVLLKPCKLPLSLLGRTYADMTIPERSSSELKRIVAAVGRHPKPGDGHVSVSIDPSSLSAVPGNSTTTSITVLNQGPLDEHLEVSVEGIPEHWIADRPAVALSPGNKEVVSLEIQPPASSDILPGAYPLTIRISSQDSPGQVHAVEATLTIGAFYRYSASLSPAKMFVGDEVQVELSNKGNVQQLFSLTWEHRGDELVFHPNQAQLTIAEAQSDTVSFCAAQRRTSWIGRAKAYRISIEPSQGEPQILEGKVRARGRIPLSTIAASLALLLLLIVVSLARFTEPTAPTDRWHVEYWKDSSRSEELYSEEKEIDSRFLVKNWKYAPPVRNKLGKPVDSWFARIVRRIYVPDTTPITTTYRFYFYAQPYDTARLQIDNKYYLDSGLVQTPSAPRTDEVQSAPLTEEVKLDPGYHEIAIEYSLAEGNAQLRFWYIDTKLVPKPPDKSPNSDDWLVEYYPNTTWSGDPVWYQKISTNELYINWGNTMGAPVGSPDAIQLLTDWFSTRSTRKVNFQEGYYQFYIVADDGFRFQLIDEHDHLVPNSAFEKIREECDPPNPPCSLSEAVHLQGENKIIIDQREGEGEARVSLRWEPAKPPPTIQPPSPTPQPPG